MTESLHDIKRIINRNIRENGKFPTLQDICSSLNFSSEQAHKYMAALAEDGYLVKNGNWYNFAPVKLEDPLLDIIEPEPEQVEEVERKKRGRPFGSTKNKHVLQEEAIPVIESRPGYDFQIKIIRIVMAVIGAGAATISIFYTSAWSLEFLPWPLAILLSLIMVGFSVFAFEVMILFSTGEVTKSQWSKILIIGGFFFLWSISILFSLSSTVAGQINKQFVNIDAKIDYNSQEQWQLLQDQKQDARSRIEDYKQQIKTYNQILSGMNSVEARKNNRGTWNDVNYKIQTTQKNIAQIQEDIENIRKQEKALLDESKKKGSAITKKGEARPDFYSWLATVLGVRTDRVQLFLAILPALFADIMAPFGVAVALFLRKK
jgi:hypothetical protein